ncbi:MAG: phosphoribosylanthranilate isomerase [Eubacteriales bacterium]
MEIKICGMMRPQDIDFVNVLQPDYVGFILAPSRRKISPEFCRYLTDKLDNNIQKVGVFVNSSSAEINDIIRYCNIDITQLHGDEKPPECKKIMGNVWKAIRIRGKEDLINTGDYDVEGYLLDTYHEKMAGGTGESFSWNIIQGVLLPKKTILAGGISLNNIEKAIMLDNIQCIDISSGVETHGVKDFYKIKEIIERVRQYE